MVSSELQSTVHTESERRQATILFADISGFTSMSEKMDPELVTSTMNECFKGLGAIVERNGGVIDKFIGDCIMVLFGVPKAVEDSPRRAVQTALEMRDCIQESRRTRSAQADLDIHIGINTGEVISGDVGSEQKREYTVMGDAVNLASRLKDAAPKGRIYVGPQTHRQTKEGFEYKDLEPIALKGKENPVLVYELLGKKAGLGQGRMVFSPLVGRQKELDQLELQVLKAINGEGSIVHVIGEAGLGKSRLLAELRNKECMQRVTLLEGRAQSYGKNLSFHPIIDLLRKWAGIREEDGEAEAFRKLEKSIRSVNPDEAEEALPFIATLMGMKLTGKHAQRMEGIIGDTLAKLIFSNARDVLSRGAQRRPLVIVLEDMHWADESTVEFVEYLFRMVEKERVLFLNVFRPREERGEKLSKAARESYGSRYVEIVLQPLDGEGCRELVQNLLRTGSVPPTIMESIGSRTGGNPFFIEEIMRACIDEQAVKVGKDGFRVTEKIGSFVVPSTVNEVIMARFDKLDKGSRELLRIASVIGRSFFYSILVQIAQGVGDIEGKIGSLKEMQILLERSRAEEVEYLFKHALAQEAIYDSILLQIRKNLHLSVAHAIESIFPDRLREFAGMLAWHYTRAEEYDKAEEYMIRAGEEALKSAASSEAIIYYRDALDLYLKKQGENADPAKVVMLEKNIARSLYYRGRYSEAIPYYDRLQTYYGVAAPKGRLAAAFLAALGIAKCLLRLYGPERRKPKPLTPELREGLVLTVEKAQMMITVDPLGFAAQALIAFWKFLNYELRDSEAGLTTWIGISALFSWSGISLSVSRQVLKKASRWISPSHPGSLVFYRMNKLIVCYFAGEWDDREGFRDPLVERQLEQGSVLDILHLLYYTGNICLAVGDWNTFHGAHHMLQEISERFDNDEGRWMHLLLAVDLHLARRMSEEASAALAELYTFSASKSASFGELLLPFAHADSVRVSLLRGDFGQAGGDPNRAWISPNKSAGSVMHDGFLWGTGAAVALKRARLAAGKGRLSRSTRRECLAALRLYLKIARKFAPDLTEALKFLGSYWWYVGSRRRALSYWKQSIHEGERLGAKVELAHMFSDAGALLGEMAPGPEWRKRGAGLYAELGIGRE
jgi:class 3 adenylate cyclase/tetratricopeptide (TPR) repeat protein